MSCPVILLVFANDRAPHGAWLRALDREHDRITDALAHAVRGGLCQVETVYNATHDQFFERLTRFSSRIVGIHFAGHANADGLCLDSEERRPLTAAMQSLIDAFEQLPRLRWIFLNGCGTEAHVAALQRRIPVPVVATSSAILDEVACDFAGQFYCSMAHGKPLLAAFDLAMARVKSEVHDAPRALRPPAQQRMLRPAAVRDAWPWALHLPPGRRRARWRLRPPRRPQLRRLVSAGVMLLMSAAPSIVGELGGDAGDGLGVAVSEALDACECAAASSRLARLDAAAQRGLWATLEARCGSAPQPGSCAEELSARRDDAASVHRCDEARALQRRLAEQFWVEPSPLMRAHCPGS